MGMPQLVILEISMINNGNARTEVCLKSFFFFKNNVTLESISHDTLYIGHKYLAIIKCFRLSCNLEMY